MRVTALYSMLVAIAPGIAIAQQIPVRELGPAQAVSDSVSIPALTRPLSDGRLLVGQGRRLMMFSSDLKSRTVALDSNSLGSGGPFGSLPFAPAMIAGLADTTFVVDMGSSSLLIIDPAGKQGRMVALPRARDATQIGLALTNMTAFIDPKGRLIYRASFPPPPPPPPGPDGSRVMNTSADTFPIVRADFDTRTADTVGVLKVTSFTRTRQVMGANNRITRTSIVQPLPSMDAWTMLPDGTIAVVRGNDYHVDWLAPDGTRSSSPKMPFDWRKVTDEDRTRIVDSVKTMQEKQRVRTDSMYKARGIDPSTVSLPTYEVVAPGDLPDYYPPVRDAGISSDPDGNLWVLPATSSVASKGLLYDVINRKGEVFERVQLPTGCALAALAKDGVVYLLCTTLQPPRTDGTYVPPVGRIERRQIKRSASH